LNHFNKNFMMKSESRSYISLQRHDWGELIDIEVEDIKDKDKLKIDIVSNQNIFDAKLFKHTAGSVVNSNVNMATEQLMANHEREREGHQTKHCRSNSHVTEGIATFLGKKYIVRLQ